jgi:hypothetical protein
MKLTSFGKIFAAILCVQVAAIEGRANTIDYRFSSTPVNLTTTSYNYGGVTVTGGPGSLFVNVSNGLSILGGDNNFAVDVGESIDFAFDAGSATGISLRTQGGPFASISIAAFGLSGALGTHSVNVTGLGPAIDISTLFGSAEIAHFSLTTTSGGHRPYILEFTPGSASVPDTVATLGLLAASLVSLGAIKARGRCNW